MRDLRYGVRSMLRAPGYSVLMLATLTLGLASGTAMFSVVDGVLLKDLPYPQPERLVFVGPTTAGGGRPHFSPPDFVDLRESAESFADICAIQGDGLATLSIDGRPSPIRAREVTASVLAVYGVRPILGRGFEPADRDTEAFAHREASASPRPPGAVVVSQRLWQERFGADPSILGQIVALDFDPYEIVGVVPTGFDAVVPDDGDYRDQPDIWVLTRMNFRTMPRDASFLRVIARLKHDRTVEQARAEMAVFAARQRTAHPLHRDAGFEVDVDPLHVAMTRRHAPTILVLFGAVGVLWSIACANLAVLQLTRSVARGREFAVRLALGASRGHLVRQVLTETVLYAVVGTALAIPLAGWMTAGLLRLAPASIPGLNHVGLSGSVLTFALGSALTVSVLVAVLPCLRLTRPRAATVLGATARAWTGAGRWAGDTPLVVVQVGFSVVLLVGTVLLVRSLTALLSVEPGFRPQQVTTADLYLTESRYPRYPRADARVRFVRELSERLLRLPGVEAASLALVIPLSRQDAGHTFATEAMTATDGTLPPAKYRPVTPGYFRAAGTRLRSGRDFDWHDLEQERLVSIVDERLAARAWPEQDAVGKRLRVEVWSTRGGTIHLEPLWTEVVGVAETVRSGSLRADDIETVYLPYGLYAVAELSLLVRAATDPMWLSDAIRRESAQVDPDVILTGMRSMDDVVAESLALERFSLILLGALAVTGLTLSLIGVYGVISQFVNRRRREIGIRMALGARAPDVRRGVLWLGTRLIAGGIGCGLLAAVGVSRFLEGLLFGVSALEAVVYVMVAAAVFALGLAACDVPARRASRLDPVITLRME
jgi:putative ABC transport system permease protein